MPLLTTSYFSGTESQRLYVLVLKRIGPPPLALTINPNGQIMYATTSLCTLLGYNSKQLLNKSFSVLLPAPWSQLHMRWLKVCVSEARLVVDCLLINFLTNSWPNGTLGLSSYLTTITSL
jgi:hypothetical protein